MCHCLIFSISYSDKKNQSHMAPWCPNLYSLLLLAKLAETFVYCGSLRSKTCCGKHPVSISERFPSGPPDASPPADFSVCVPTIPLEQPSASLSLLMMFLYLQSHQQFSLMVLVILVIRTAQSVGSHLESLTWNTVRPRRFLRLQETFNSPLNQVPMLRNVARGETESLCCESPYG